MTIKIFLWSDNNRSVYHVFKSNDKRKSLRKENQDLKTDPAVIEKIAREQFGYQKSDEKVFRFLPDNGGNQTQKSKQSDAEGK